MGCCPAKVPRSCTKLWFGCSFSLVDEPTVNLVAWTTTPWTLPSNLGLCVNPTFTYVKIEDKKTSKVYIFITWRARAPVNRPAVALSQSFECLKLE